MAEIRKLVDGIAARIARSARAIADRFDGGDPYRVGRPVLDLDGDPMLRCSSCGIPRGIVRHALSGCADPDARRTL